MRKLFLILTISLVSLATYAQEIKWMSFEQAIEAQKENSKPIFMDAYTIWCGPCKMLDKNTFGDPKIADYINANYNPVKFDAEGTEVINYKGQEYTNPQHDPNRKGRNASHQFTEFLRIPGYPSMVIFDNSLNVQDVIIGYLTPDKLMERLQ
ncbi:thioredoxin family protein [Myroides sp. LJL119]